MSEDSMTERSQMAAAAPRRLMHQRTVVCDGYLRHDGLWEVDARLRDTKTFSYVHFSRGPFDPGAAVPDMPLWLPRSVARRVGKEWAASRNLGGTRTIHNKHEIMDES